MQSSIVQSLGRLASTFFCLFPINFQLIDIHKSQKDENIFASDKTKVVATMNSIESNNLGRDTTSTSDHNTMDTVSESNVVSSEGQLDEASGGHDPKYNDELHRLLSYPDGLDFSLTSLLAKYGFYCTSNIARCQFCPVTLAPVTPDLVIESHVCDKTANIELRVDIYDYRYEYNRIISFLKNNWPKQLDERIHVGALDLARSGFYYTGEADATRCNFCRLEVRGWERGDTAESEHRRWNPYCIFLSGRAVGNIPLGQEVMEVTVRDCAGLHSISNPRHFLYNSELGIHKHKPVRHPEYASLISRLNSFDSWPLSMAQRPQQLAEAGFYYTGSGDRVICFQCDGGLKDWERNDQPWVQHALWFPRCSYVNLHKGTDFIESVQHLRNKTNTEDISSFPVENTTVSSKPILKPSSLLDVPNTSGVNEHITETSSAQVEISIDRRCTVCLDQELGIVFLPCGHLAACIDCAPQLQNCPICRGHISAFIRAHLP